MVFFWSNNYEGEGYMGKLFARFLHAPLDIKIFLSHPIMMIGLFFFAE
jgi:hypothetical protein